MAIAQPYIAGESPVSAGTTPLPSAETSTALAQAQIRQGAAVGALGEQAASIGESFAAARRMTAMNDATTTVLKGMNELETKYSNDTDFKTAPSNFKSDADKLVGGALAGAQLPDQYKSELQARLTRLYIGSQSTVERSALAREQQANVANLNNQDIALQTRYLRAGSDGERTAVFNDHAASIADMVKAGWITADNGQQRLQQFRSQAQQAQAQQMIANDPAGAQTALADPARFTYLNPVTRQQLVNQADGARDVQGQLQI
ncbi:MAG: hypothetical protein KGL46_14250, partial [Hyphomicrobiales bacterium]|nr:hypothetical protein [Hyphomicrobiales bacterium]